MSSPSNLYLDQDDLQRRLLNLTLKTGYEIVQKHGQRIYGGPPPGWNGSQPNKGTEIYCYRIPRDCFEDELVPVFSSVGKIYELRLMIEFSGTNRSYCYVRYTTQEEAREAIKKLNNYHVRPGYPLAVTRSVDNRKLSIKTMPSLEKETEKDVINELSSIVEGVEIVKYQARGWIEVEFSSHRLAALARRQLVPGNVVMFDNIYVKQVDWADPEIELSGQELFGKVLTVKNIPFDTPEHVVMDIFNRLSEGQVSTVTKVGSTVLVTFMSHGGAMAAMERGRGRELAGTSLEIAWWSNKRMDRGNYSSVPRSQQIVGQNQECVTDLVNGINNAQDRNFLAWVAQRNLLATHMSRPPPAFNLDYYAFSGLSSTKNSSQSQYIAQNQAMQYCPPSLYSVPPPYNDRPAGSQAFQGSHVEYIPRSPYSLFPSTARPSSPKPVLAVPPLYMGSESYH